MNFIDRIMNNLDALSADDVIQAMSGIYSEPVSRQMLAEYPQFIRDIVSIIDLDTCLTLSGDVLVNNVEQVPGMIEALHNIHADRDATLLSKIYAVYQVTPDYEAIWEAIDPLYREMYFYTDFDIWPLLETYVEQRKKRPDTTV